MTFEWNGGDYVPRRRMIHHYHGDAVRGLFLVSALVLIVAQSTGAELPFPTAGAVIAAIALVVSAGITNPRGFWIHWVDAFLAVIGTFLFGTAAVEHYRASRNLFDPSFAYVEALAFLSLFALYFTTRTIRGFHSRPKLP